MPRAGTIQTACACRSRRFRSAVRSRAAATFALLFSAATSHADNIPIVHAFTPHEGGPGTVVKIAGENLDHVLWIEFAGGARSDFRLFTSSMLKVDVPEGAQSGLILLRSENGGAWSPSSFRVITPPVGGLELLRPWPNPGTGPFHIGFNLPARRHVQVSVLDLAGRRVRRLMDGPGEAGAHEVVWTGRDEAGRRVPPGLYLVQLQLGDGIETRRLFVLR